MPIDSLTEQRLAASGKDEHLNVHVVSEYLFCERAGVLAKESQVPDPGLELRTVRLGYLPRYELRQLESWISRITVAMIGGGALSALGMLAGGVAAWWGASWGLVVCWVLLLTSIIGVVAGLGLLLLLTWRLAQARGAEPMEPDFSEVEAVELPWWSLVAAGYELQQWPDTVTIERWRLTGRPWRVLVRGRTAIPVLLSKRSPGKLQKNHFARIAAYCALLSEQAGIESPFGVVLFYRTTDCTAVKFSSWSLRALADGVVGMRELARLIATERLFARIPDPQHCHACPLGQLKRYQEPSLASGEAPPVAIERKGVKYQSECGYRFQWTPPHKSLKPRGTD